MIEDLVAAVFGAIGSRARPSLTGLWLHLAAGLLILLAGLYLSYAFFLAIEERLGPPWAGALTGAALMLLAGLFLLVALLLERPRRRPQSESENVAETLVRLGDLIGHKIDAPGTSMAITALLSGLVVGISPAARGFLLNLAEQLFQDSKRETK